MDKLLYGNAAISIHIQSIEKICLVRLVYVDITEYLFYRCLLARALEDFTRHVQSTVVVVMMMVVLSVMQAMSTSRESAVATAPNALSTPVTATPGVR